MIVETAEIMTTEEIVAYVKSFHHYEVDDGGTEWNCQLCGRWKGRKGHGVDHGIFLYPTEDEDDWQGELISLGSGCLKKVLRTLKKPKNQSK